MRWALFLLLLPALAGCMLSARHQAAEALRSVTAGCGAPTLVDEAPSFTEGLNEAQVRTRYGCIRAGVMRNRDVIYGGTRSPDGLEALISYQEALYYEVAAGNLQPHQASLQYLDFMAQIQAIAEQRNIQAALSAAERRAQLEELLERQNQTSTITCQQTGPFVSCTAIPAQ